MTVPCSLNPIGVVRSPIVDRKNAPRSVADGAPDAWVEIDPAFAEGLRGLEAGREVILVTWLHQSLRDVLEVRPRGDQDAPLTGVFVTRSPDRPNPIGLHRVTVRELRLGDAETPARLRVGPLEAIDGTPVVDIKPVLRRTLDA